MKGMSEAGSLGAATRSGSSAARQRWAPWNDPSEKPHVQIVCVTKSFGSFAAVDNASLAIFKRGFFSLHGPPGRGQPTLLRLLDGFRPPRAGATPLEGTNTSGRPPIQPQAKNHTPP